MREGRGRTLHCKTLVAVGACGLSGGVFRDAYNVVGGIDKGWLAAGKAAGALRRQGCTAR